MDLSIVVVNWNSTDYLRGCLASVYKTVRDVHFEVIVVDNSSGDGCEAMLASEFKGARYIAAAKNVGFARANNLGYLHSHGEALLFLNPDTEVMDNALDRMMGWLQAHPNIGALSPCLLNADGSIQQSCVQAFPTLINQFLDSDLLRSWFPRWKMWGTWPLMDPNKGSPDADVDAISGACYLVRRELFESVGRFTEEYFMYSDDVDLSYKIRQAGHSIICLTDCSVIHYGGGSSLRREPSFAAVQRRKAMSQYFERAHGTLCSGLYRLMVSLAAFLRLLVFCAVFPFVRSVEDRDGLREVLARWRSILWWAVGFKLTRKDNAGCEA
jgi:GT2 family glycosyltransferase